MKIQLKCTSNKVSIGKICCHLYVEAVEVLSEAANLYSSLVFFKIKKPHKYQKSKTNKMLLMLCE